MRADWEKCEEQSKVSDYECRDESRMEALPSLEEFSLDCKKLICVLYQSGPPGCRRCQEFVHFNLISHIHIPCSIAVQKTCVIGGGR